MSETDPVIVSLLEMGFSLNAINQAITAKGRNIEACAEWLVNYSEQLNESQQQNETETTPAQAKSLKCEDCGKILNNHEEVEYHAVKTGHEHFSESTDEKPPLTEEEKQEQLAKIEQKLKQKRLEREAREKQENLDREKNRIKSGKEMQEAKRKHEELEMKKLQELKRREKEEDRLAKLRVREQIEQDKLARKLKFGSDTMTSVATTPTANGSPVSASMTTLKGEQSYSEVQLQIRLTDGSVLSQTFGAKEPLSAVRLYVELNRKDATGPFNILIPFPRRIFHVDEYDAPLDTLGLGPRATLVITKR